MFTVVYDISSETSDIIYKFNVYETTSEFIQFGGSFMKKIKKLISTIHMVAFINRSGFVELSETLREMEQSFFHKQSDCFASFLSLVVLV